MTSARFSLPLLQVGQAQKEVTHNESIQALENVVQPVVEGAPSNSPPAAPEIGRQYLVGDAPQGAFANHATSLATWTQAGWLFTQPRDKLTVTDRATGLTWSFDGVAWQGGIVRASEVHVQGQKVLGQRQPSITIPGGGTVVDQEARAAISAVISAMRQHGLISS